MYGSIFGSAWRSASRPSANIINIQYTVTDFHSSLTKRYLSLLMDTSPVYLAYSASRGTGRRLQKKSEKPWPDRSSRTGNRIQISAARKGEKNMKRASGVAPASGCPAFILVPGALCRPCNLHDFKLGGSSEQCCRRVWFQRPCSMVQENASATCL